ncbi:hypothetical protein ALC60_11663 [Trachymyrmex zeteki]|uniref:Uncharacterized protein n=1 Tax=Mycetomoellerius zeteki TaxID=64791 RepID=A0A151WN29_9HYME|nr:hypothetical protein ALC60_11663 [Trachymyrmex zeteki]
MPKPFLLIGGGGGGSGGSSGGVGLSAFSDRPVAANRFDEEIKLSYICETHCTSSAYES